LYGDVLHELRVITAMCFMNDALGTSKIREEDGMSTATSRTSSADEPGEQVGQNRPANVEEGNNWKSDGMFARTSS
jgi:hypothetical protein